jgi:rhodanese-related sulfurtransferase
LFCTFTLLFLAFFKKKFMQHSLEFLKLVDEVKTRIKEVSVPQTQQRIKAGANLIDVREDNEWDAGHAKDAMHLGRGIIERDIVGKFPDKNAELILYCGGGFRAALSADNLQKMGYNNVFSMEGGWRAWKESGAPTG